MPSTPLTWIFGYGSLIWRPGFHYADRRTAVLEGYHRAFVRYSLRHRGTPQQPGLVVGLREGGSCMGVAFAVQQTQQSAVLDYLDAREGPGYLRRKVALALPEDGGPRRVDAWTYLPNPRHPSYFGEESPRRLIELVATGRGESGTALDYLRELIAHLRELRVDEPALAAVLSAAERYQGEA